MTREEAIRVLMKLNEFLRFSDEDIRKALDIAIEALSAEPSDLISRADVVNEIQRYERHFNTKLESLYVLINELPSADRPSGEWINLFDNIWECSNCEVCEQFGENIESTSNFCPSCGARMKGGDDE